MLRRLLGDGTDRGNRSETPSYLQGPKLHAIEYAFDRFGVRSFADLGGVWAVNAGYTFHGLSQPGVESAYLVDTGINDEVRRRAADEPRLNLVDGEFGDESVIAGIGSIDAVLLFDVLLHQVDPDWDEVLRRWSDHTRAFIVVQPQLRDGDRTMRLIDLPPEEYARYVPGDHIAVEWDRLDEVDERYGKPFRDIHEYWQWGIPDAALVEAMAKLGRRMYYYCDHGQWRDVATFQNVAFVFAP